MARRCAAQDAVGHAVAIELPARMKVEGHRPLQWIFVRSLSRNPHRQGF